MDNGLWIKSQREKIMVQVEDDFSEMLVPCANKIGSDGQSICKPLLAVLVEKYCKDEATGQEPNEHLVYLNQITDELVTMTKYSSIIYHMDHQEICLDIEKHINKLFFKAPSVAGADLLADEDLPLNLATNSYKVILMGALIVKHATLKLEHAVNINRDYSKFLVQLIAVRDLVTEQKASIQTMLASLPSEPVVTGLDQETVLPAYQNYLEKLCQIHKSCDLSASDVVWNNLTVCMGLFGFMFLPLLTPGLGNTIQQISRSDCDLGVLVSYLTIFFSYLLLFSLMVKTYSHLVAHCSKRFSYYKLLLLHLLLLHLPLLGIGLPVAACRVSGPSKIFLTMLRGVGGLVYLIFSFIYYPPKRYMVSFSVGGFFTIVKMVFIHCLIIATTTLLL
ncbi:hypothetical protein NEDG_01716 [Nematocida displodere]|uniref:Uncharacterized protein n=1 Tax=Nematocida displodere TaxID=1805483 RepID=A0A177EDU3_9MICR|nr:hypothetical protein NEDG_01716 [Nematocida displodere]